MIKRFQQHADRFSVCLREAHEEPVRNNLALTPSKMLEMTTQGIPIRQNTSGMTYEEGVSELDFEPRLEYRRGIDIADAYEARERIKGKLREGMRKGLFNQEPAKE